MNYWLPISTTLAAISWTTFVVWYWIRATWWKSQIGKNVMILGLLIAFVFTRTSLLLWFGPHHEPSTQQVITGIFINLAAAAIGVQRTYLMEQSQRHPVKQNRRKDDPK